MRRAALSANLLHKLESTLRDVDRDAPIVQTLAAAQGALAMTFGVLPGIFNANTTGPMIREAQRHLAHWTLEPISKLIAEEATTKLGGTVTIDVVQPLQAYDAGGMARTFSAMIGAMATAKAERIDPGPAMHLLDWKDGA